MQWIASCCREAPAVMYGRRCGSRRDSHTHSSAVVERYGGSGGTLEPSALALEESLEDVPALIGHQSTDDLRSVIGARVPQQVIDGTRHATARIIRPEDHPTDLGQHDGTGALGTGLERDVQCGQKEAVLLHLLEGALQGE